MKYRFLKLSIFSFTTYFLAVPVNADLAELNSNDVSTDRIEQLTRTLAQGEYSHAHVPATATIAISESESESESEITPTRYSNLKVEKKNYYPDSNIHTLPKIQTSSWSVNCEKTKFDNMKICDMNAGDLWVFLINGRYSVSVGSNHYPRSKGGLRIDNSKAIYGYEGDLPKPLSIIERLKKGKIAYTRYQEWPYEYNKDGEVSLKDFTKQFNEMLKQYKNL